MQAYDEIERFFSIAEPARILGFERSTIYSRIKEGRLRAVRLDGVKRIPRSELVRVISAAQPVAAGCTKVSLDREARPRPRSCLCSEPRRGSVQTRAYAESARQIHLRGRCG